MTNSERDELSKTLRRMYMTKDGETICLTSEQVNVVLMYIEDLEDGVE